MYFKDLEAVKGGKEAHDANQRTNAAARLRKVAEKRSQRKRVKQVKEPND